MMVTDPDICSKQLILGGSAGHSWNGDNICRQCGGTPMDSHSTFARRLQSLINAHSEENGSDTPDFILARYLLSCLSAWNDAVKRREKWYGREVGRLDPQFATAVTDAPNAPSAEVTNG